MDPLLVWYDGITKGHCSWTCGHDRGASQGDGASLRPRAGKRMFFYSTTGWMMWNAVIASLIVGAAAVLYDGSPVRGGADALWRIADETGATLFGASPTLPDNGEG